MAEAAAPLRIRIEEDMKAALRAGDKRRLGVIRLMLAAVKQREIDERVQLDGAGIIAVLDKLIKQRRDSVAQYRAGNRPDLVEQESFEIELIQEYLPAALSEAEIDQAIEAAIAETGAGAMRDMGKVMGILKPALQGRADLGAVSAKVKQRLSAG